ncbi:ABC transporter family substrate-binding protein [Pseudonocardia thermophila]|uniref:ABC transporter family substrate-binding protein n=1 Tax=Pseudonocardia thermophila TaxID=1848 RepID=UPI00248F364B|nr:ABC transporter family substrate-binding protein [Pseudonocardia thermophila]
MGRRTWIVLLALVAMVAAACANEPVPPPEVTPTPTATPTTQPGTPTQIVVGVDDLPPGFNPHLLADVSPVTQALATLVLPSVFRVDENGVAQLDTTIATSAKVTSSEPFTVSYELNLEASWSTNAPIAAEDFVFLWERMRAEPGVADAAGYRLITAVRSRAGGKAVDVEFAEPYPAWQYLFSGLLPAHLLKDAPGSWVGALRNGLPASGGPFKVGSVDRGRGEIVLVRNDLYWDAPTVVDELVLRRLDPEDVAAGLASGDIDLAVTTAGPELRTALVGLQPAPRTQPVPRAEVVTLGLRADTGPLRNLAARKAVAALIDREAIRAEVAPEALRADAYGRAPSQPGYTATAPERRADAAEVAALLQQAGWTRTSPTAPWMADGAPVRLTIGAGAERPGDLRVAAAVARQLSGAGIPATVVAPPVVDLYSAETVAPTPPSTSAAPTSGATATPAAAPATAATPTPTPTEAAPAVPAAPTGIAVDLMVLNRPAAGDAATAVASEFGCMSGSATGPEQVPGPTGFCQPLLDALMTELMTPDPRPDLAQAVQQDLWEQAAELPLFQPVDVVVSTPESDAATGVGPGPLLTGPFTGAQRWRPLPSS